MEGILVDEATHRATDRQIDYRPAEPVTAKGKADAVPVWVAVAPKASLGVEVDQAGRAALVGREREVQLLRAALDRVREKQSAQLVTLVGVPGIGKSRLVWELKELVEAEAELTLWRQGRCRDAPEMLLPALAFHAHVLLAIALRGLGRAGEQLLEAGRRAGCNAQLQRALAFYRQVRATAYLREGEAVLAASA